MNGHSVAQYSTIFRSFALLGVNSHTLVTLPNLLERSFDYEYQKRPLNNCLFFGGADYLYRASFVRLRSVFTRRCFHFQRAS